MFRATVIERTVAGTYRKVMIVNTLAAGTRRVIIIWDDQSFLVSIVFISLRLSSRSLKSITTNDTNLLSS